MGENWVKAVRLPDDRSPEEQLRQYRETALSAIQEFEDRIDALEWERNKAVELSGVLFQAQYGDAKKMALLEDERDALRTRIAGLEAALEPFANAAPAYDEVWQDGEYLDEAEYITIGDLRRARSAKSEGSWK